MPTHTFFHLPEEKQHRLTEAAWQEFTRTSCVNASINRIVRVAQIPRGSFYQYFTDKEDLFTFLLQDLCGDFWDMVTQKLQAYPGDLFAALLAVFDCWFLQPSVPTLSTARRLLLLLKNPSLDWHQIIFSGNIPVFPHRVQILSASFSSMPQNTGAMETTAFLAVSSFTDVCKCCFFMPENALVFRQKLLQGFQLLSSCNPSPHVNPFLQGAERYAN